MNEVLQFAYTLKYPSKFDSCKMLLNNWNGSKIYLFDSEAEKNLCLGWPTMICETNGKLGNLLLHAYAKS